jgi:hypothetical protein
MVQSPQKSISQLTWVILSGAGFILFVVIAAALIRFSNQTGNIKPQIYYFLLVIVGLIAAGFLFGALKSHAKYSGKVYNGTLELGGPTVLFIIVIYMGIKLASPPGKFTLRFIVFGPGKNELISKGMLKVLFDKPDSAQIQNGSVDFTDVSAELQGKTITVIPSAENYQTAAQTISVPGNGTPVEIHLTPKADTITLSGLVINTGGQPVANAVVMIDNGHYSSKTDQYGNFKAVLPVKEGTELPVRVYYNNKLCYNNSQTLSGKVSLTLQLH